jgi:hypothetical protein
MNEQLKLQRLAGILTESQYMQLKEEEEKEEKLLDLLKNGMDKVVGGIEKEFKEEAEGEDKELNEGFLTIASIAIAMPAILGLISKFGKWAGNTIGKLLGKKPDKESDYQEWMKKLGNIADELHHLYMAPIKSIVKKFVKDEKKADKITHVIFHLIVAGFLIASGVTAVKAFQAKNVSLTTLEGALTAIKTGEVSTFIGEFAELSDVADELISKQ